MIEFTSIKWKNFLATGDYFTEIKLNEHPNTLVIGANGSGKSTLLDAITFCLFGTAFRDINKSGLVNSVNGKDCVVECEFNTATKQYKIIRGIKPNIFEIYCDGVLLNQESSVKDYQKHLEQFILKMNKKAFLQIDILGSTSFTPFMQLKPPERRLIIEDLLDIQIFSTMNLIAKQRLQKNKEELETVRIECTHVENNIDFVKRTIEGLEQNNEQKLKTLLDKRQQYADSIVQMEALFDELVAEEKTLVKKTRGIDKLKLKYREYLDVQTRLEAKVDQHYDHLTFYESNDACPTCEQSITEEFKGSVINKITQEKDTVSGALDKVQTTISDAIDLLNEMDLDMRRISAIQNERDLILSKIDAANDVLAGFDESIKNINNADELLTNANDQYKSLTEMLDGLQKKKEELLIQRQYIDTALVLLKDGGIKGKVIKQYLPVINTLLNKYLNKMGFFIEFHIDENFEETIKSRYRDTFAYQNFSEGEKARIDLAILFTWRAIAKMRNSVNTNLLIFDEIFDGSLDLAGTDEFVKIMYENHDINIFVISHKTELLMEKFKKVHKFEKRRNFSHLT